MGTLLAGAEQQKMAISTIRAKMMAVIKSQTELPETIHFPTLSFNRGILQIPAVKNKDIVKIIKTFLINPIQTAPS